MKIAALLPAAGRSSRLGDPRRHKLLARLEGEPLLRRAVRVVLEAGVEEVVVVTGARAPEIAATVSDLPVRIWYHAGYASGMAGSLQAGRAALTPPGPDGLLILLPDMPLVTPAHVAALCDAFRKAGGATVIRAASGRVPGHPLILPRALYQRFDELAGDSGAKPLLQGAPLITLDIGPAALIDADTPEALAALGAGFEAPERH